jgi:hypothetical protein
MIERLSNLGRQPSVWRIDKNADPFDEESLRITAPVMPTNTPTQKPDIPLVAAR